GSGTIVRSSSVLGAALNRYINKSNLVETLEVRMALEREAARLASQYRTGDVITWLEESMDACQRAAGNKDIEGFVQADLLFHKRGVQAAHNQMLFDLYEYMTESLYTSIQSVMTMDDPFAYGNVLHYDLLKAIHKQDEDLATTYVNDYIDDF